MHGSGFFFSGKGGGPNVWYLFILRDIPNAEFNLLSKSSKYTNILQRTIDADSEKSSIKQNKKKSSDVFPWNAIYYGNGSKYKDTESFISEKL